MIFDSSSTYYFECLTLDVLRYYKQASFWTRQKCSTELHLWKFKLFILFSAKTLQQEQKNCISQRGKQVALSENKWKVVSVQRENFRQILLNDKMFLHFDIQFHCTVMIWKSNLEKSSIFLKFKCSWNKRVSFEGVLADVFQNSCSYKFRNIHIKIPLLKAYF